MDMGVLYEKIQVYHFPHTMHNFAPQIDLSENRKIGETFSSTKVAPNDYRSNEI